MVLGAHRLPLAVGAVIALAVWLLGHPQPWQVARRGSGQGSNGSHEAAQRSSDDARSGWVAAQTSSNRYQRS